MKHLSHSCRCGTWKRVCIAFNAGCLIAISAGCSFDDFSKTSSTVVPACGRAATGKADAATPHGLVARWTFDENSVPPNGWRDWHQERLLTAAGSGSPTIAATQVNGTGHALSMDGQTYLDYDAPLDDDAIFPKDGFTLSAWISLHLDDLTLADAGSGKIWPIISTMGGNEPCGGYQLDLRTDGGPDGLKLALSYQVTSQADAGSSCVDTTRTLDIPLNKPSWAWGAGRWHHVVATYAPQGGSQASLALYWDGEPIATNTPIGSIYEGVISYRNRVLRVGANGKATAGGTDSLLPANLDDVAIFDRALSEDEIADFSLATSTNPGPSGCRWNASEEWDFTSRSSGAWAPDTSPSHAKIRVVDLDWGAGFLSARLIPELDLRNYSKAYMTANVPKDTVFVFSVAAGDDACNWMLRGNGADRYVVDLTKPSFCVSTTCSFNMDHVQWARVSSDWATTENEFDIAVTGLEFDSAGSKVDHSNTQGGTIGPKGWCWRPQSYNPNSLAAWVGSDLPTRTSVSATFRGDERTTVRLVADFGDHLLDISKCSRIEIDATLPISNPAVPYFNFVMGAFNGAERQWKLDKPAETYSIDLSKYTWDSTASGDSTFVNVKPGFDHSRVRMLGIEKPYEFAESSAISIADIRFYKSNGEQGCEALSVP
jgi:hypothetical protein